MCIPMDSPSLCVCGCERRVVRCCHLKHRQTPDDTSASGRSSAATQVPVTQVTGHRMTASHSTSFAVSASVSVIIVASELLFKSFLSSSQMLTIVTGFLNSMLFVFMLTAVSNLQMMSFGPGFQSKFPEVLLCLTVACASAGLVHRVSVTTCLIFSLIALYRLTRSQHSVQTPVVVPVKKKR